jgi:hypothetical protein
MLLGQNARRASLLHQPAQAFAHWRPPSEGNGHSAGSDKWPRECASRHGSATPQGYHQAPMHVSLEARHEDRGARRLRSARSGCLYGRILRHLDGEEPGWHWHSRMRWRIQWRPMPQCHSCATERGWATGRAAARSRAANSTSGGWWRQLMVL